MIYRLFLSLIVLLAFVADYHMAPGGAKFNFDSLSTLALVISILFTWSWIIFWDALRESPKRIGLFIIPLLFALMTLIHYYELNSGGELESSMILDNWKGIADASGFKLLRGLFYDNFVAANVFWAFLIAGLFALTYLEKRSKLLGFFKRHSLLFKSTPFFLLIILTFGFRSTFENYTGLFRGLTERVYSRPSHLQALAESLKSPLPTITLESAYKNSAKVKPNVILVLVESLSSYFIQTKAPDGTEYMPYFNSLISQGLYFSRHYSVSVQTTRGQFAAFCGKIPLYQGLEAADYPTHDFDCLPRYLKKEGYTSIFMQAFGKQNFDNTHDFLLSQGFDQIPQIAHTCDQEPADVPCWNWGIQDDDFYRRVFHELKTNEKLAVDKKPFFLALATITSHMPFKGTPEKLIVHFKQPHNRLENYVNTLTVVDNSLEVLIEEIKKSKFSNNTILMITGDHGFPMGQHDNFHNENYAFEENFKVPLLILDFRGKSKSPLLSGSSHRFDLPSSHMNLPASILDLIGYQGPTSFQAVSLFALLKSVDKSQPIYLVQPYSGILLGSIRWPWKYLFEKKTDREFIYNLEKDPQERQALKAQDIPTDLLEKLRLDVAAIIWSTKNTKSHH